MYIPSLKCEGVNNKIEHTTSINIISKYKSGIFKYYLKFMSKSIALVMCFVCSALRPK